MPFYESTFIVRQDVPVPQVESLTSSLAALVVERGGTVVKTESWGLKSLAYRIKKNRKGHYVMLGLDAPPAAVTELERNLRINEDVLRYLTVKVDKMDATPSAMMLSRHARDERRGREGDDRRGRFGDERGRLPVEERPRTRASGRREDGDEASAAPETGEPA
jgi:small subunit ribosomal protein S6